MSLTVTIPAVVDDDGTGLTGDALNNAWLQTVLKVAIDAALGSLTTVTPTTITANQNNYSPTSLSTAQVLRLASDASRTITGIVAQSGRRLILSNCGTQNIVLAHNSGSSSAANRIVCPNSVDLTLNQGDSVEVFYDSVSALWRALGV